MWTIDLFVELRLMWNDTFHKSHNYKTIFPLLVFFCYGIGKTLTLATPTRRTPKTNIQHEQINKCDHKQIVNIDFQIGIGIDSKPSSNRRFSFIPVVPVCVWNYIFLTSNTSRYEVKLAQIHRRDSFSVYSAQPFFMFHCWAWVTAFRMRYGIWP